MVLFILCFQLMNVNTHTHTPLFTTNFFRTVCSNNLKQNLYKWALWRNTLMSQVSSTIAARLTPKLTYKCVCVCVCVYKHTYTYIAYNILHFYFVINVHWFKITRSKIFRFLYTMFWSCNSWHTQEICLYFSTVDHSCPEIASWLYCITVFKFRL